MFGRKKAPQTNLKFFGEAAQASTFDYLVASMESGTSPMNRAAFFVLAYLQAVAAMFSLTLADSSDETLPEGAVEGSIFLEETLRQDMVRVMEKGLTAIDGQGFLSEGIIENLKEQGLLQKKCQALEMGVDACWDVPFSNVLKYKE